MKKLVFGPTYILFSHKIGTKYYLGIIALQSSNMNKGQSILLESTKMKFCKSVLRQLPTTDYIQCENYFC